MFWAKRHDAVHTSGWNRHDDPLTKALEPPLDETPQERHQRFFDQQEALRVSREIDEGIQDAKKLIERRKKAIKVLLLGQAESGKSTTLKNFQLASSPDHFQNEQAAWRAVIQLNMICSIKRILEVLQLEWDAEPGSPTSRSRPTTGSSSSSLTDEHRRIRMRLSPLLAVESDLNRKLLPENCEWSYGKEICVRADSSWKRILESAITPKKSQKPGTRDSRSGSNPGTAEGGSADDPTMILSACRDDIITLWKDPAVRAALHKNNVRLDQQPGFFLNDTKRIARPSYVPTPSDIVRARLRTIGVQEHKLMVNDGGAKEWYIYDVGGSRCTRPQWIPFFDDIQAIIFLAPLAFNQVLEEDPNVNRLEDSVHLWREICANKLLANASIILFLNKMDILQDTLAMGVRVAKYVPSYGDLPNDFHHVTKYFRDKFRHYHKRLSPRERPFMCYQTSVIDTLSTTAMLLSVREGILHHHLERSHVL